MPKNKTTVLYISKLTIQVATINLDKDPEIDSMGESTWTENNLPRKFKLIKERFNISEVKILLDNEFTHTLKLEIPNSIAEDEEKIESKIKEKHPTIINNDYWQYKKFSSTKSHTELIVFSPQPSILKLLETSASQAGLRIQDIESVEIALERHENPLIGLAVKDTNTVPPPKKESPSTPRNHPTKPTLEDLPSGTNTSKSSLLPKIAIIALIIVVLGFLGYKFKDTLMSKLPNSDGNNGIITIEPSPIATSTPAPSPSPTAKLGSYSIQILNGTGEPGIASQIQAQLEEEGFTTTDTGNAGNYNYDKTEINVKQDTPKSVYLAIEKVLSKDYLIEQKADLAADHDYDVVVIIGSTDAETE